MTIFSLSDYESLFHSLSKDWLFLELKHRVSKTATQEFWSLALKSFPKLLQKKDEENVKKKIPQFRSIRQKLYDDYLPEIFLEVAYEVKETGDTIILRDLTKTPLKQFPPSKYRKLYEAVKVKVRNAALI